MDSPEPEFKSLKERIAALRLADGLAPPKTAQPGEVRKKRQASLDAAASVPEPAPLPTPETLPARQWAPARPLPTPDDEPPPLSSRERRPSAPARALPTPEHDSPPPLPSRERRPSAPARALPTPDAESPPPLPSRERRPSAPARALPTPDAESPPPLPSRDRRPSAPAHALPTPEEEAPPLPARTPKRSQSLGVGAGAGAPPPPLPSRANTGSAPRRPIPLPPAEEEETPALPPRLPPRTPTRGSLPPPAEEEAPRRAPPLPSSARPPLPTSAKPQPTAAPRRVSPSHPPPAVPAWDRPKAAVLPPSPATTTHSTSPPLAAAPGCLQCRDFSAADAVGALYPRASLPPDDPVGFLAHHLCAPFPSPTDKARAIFTWLHHNMAYDVASFVGHLAGGELAHSTPADSIRSGTGVCSGYAGAYAAIAVAAGLECIEINGHGKGVGHVDWVAGQPVPPFDANHAWNAVRLESGWKLLDACWGAGWVDLTAQTFNREFKPEMFTRPNELFGWAHFPEDPAHWFRDDGTAPSWPEYVAGPGRGVPLAQCFGQAEGIDPFTVTPGRDIAVGSAEVVRLQFGKVCGHWKSEVHGGQGGRAAPLVLLPLANPTEFVPFNHTPDGCWWWLDVPAHRLGERGGRAMATTLKSIGGRSGRGVSGDEFLRLHRREQVAFDSALVVWELV
ncbi:hypothetical protein Q8F55_002833 [Vanrija albida]|uniref:Transglutaminase-like domain-containing protein n=1 Tax=Vanrija albida TaxID=181172 RepID=A0ABR3QB35_9TREE